VRRGEVGHQRQAGGDPPVLVPPVPGDRGGRATHNALFKAEAITLTGELASNSYIAESGNELTHFFCPQCGTQVLGKPSARMHLRVVRLGVLDQPHDLRPTAAIWVEDAPPYAVIDPRWNSGRASHPRPRQNRAPE
jgi:hypothetical protein